MIHARELDIPARDFQREAKRAEVEAKEAERAADIPSREAEQKMCIRDRADTVAASRRARQPPLPAPAKPDSGAIRQTQRRHPYRDERFVDYCTYAVSYTHLDVYKRQV